MNVERGDSVQSVSCVIWSRIGGRQLACCCCQEKVDGQRRRLILMSSRDSDFSSNVQECGASVCSACLQVNVKEA